jgi:hypothetical protein
MEPEERQRIYEEELVRFQAREHIRNKYEIKDMGIKFVIAVISAVFVFYLITALAPYFINSLVSSVTHSIPAVKH